jgi:DNA-binding beta-propeller fold protein YncE
MRAPRLLLILALALIGGCSEREHANPFDPANPGTGGRPVGFAALAGDAYVHLVWSPSSATGLAGFQLQRRVAGQGDYIAIPGTYPATSPGTLDLSVQDGVTYEYRLYHVFTGGPGGLPAEDRATPGPARVFATDADGHALRRLTADGRHVAESFGGYSSPAEAAVDPDASIVWFSDAGAGALVALIGSTPFIQVTPGMASPGAVAIDPVDHSAWVCDATAGLVRHVLPSGALAASLSGLLEPLGVAVDPADRSVWVCERGGNAVRRFSHTGTQLGMTVVDLPSRLAIDSLTRMVWVTSYSTGRVVRLSPSVVPVDTLTGFAGPVGVDIDHVRGVAWIADATADQVVAVDRAGQVLHRVGGLTGARMVAVSPVSGEAWVAASALGRVVRLSAAGVVLESSDGFVRPWGIALDRTR